MSMEEENEVKSKAQGKRKISIEKIQDKARKQVTFSKRRKGVFKKASELCTLCNAEIAVLTFSGAGKVFTFGHPSADDVINRYNNNNNNNNIGSTKILSTSLSSSVTHECVGKDEQDLFWWQRSIEGIGLDELEKFRDSLTKLRNNVASKIGNCWSNDNNNNNDVGCSSAINVSKSGLDLNEAYNPMVSNEAGE